MPESMEVDEEKEIFSARLLVLEEQ